LALHSSSSSSSSSSYPYHQFLFKQLGQLVSIVKQHIRDYLDEIFVLIKEYWHSPLLDQIVGLVEEISMALNDEFKVIYLFIL